MAASISGIVGFQSLATQYLAGNLANGQSQLVFGSSNFVTTNSSLVYGTGATLSSGAYQVNDWYLKQLTITTASSYNITFSGGVDVNPFGTVLAFTSVKLIIVSLNAPNFGTLILKVGPQNVGNAAQLWFGGVTAACFDNVYGTRVYEAPAAGWTVNSTTASLLPLVNGTASTIVVNVFIAGVK